MNNLESNDDVFADDDNEPAAAPQHSNIGRHKSIDINGGNVPGYLVEAVERYITETGGSFDDNHIGVPFSAQMFARISKLTSTVYTPDNLNMANAAMWKTLNNITGGMLEVEYEKCKYEDQIVGYASLANMVNQMYIEIKEHAENDNYPETFEVVQQLLVYFDLLNSSRR